MANPVRIWNPYPKSRSGVQNPDPDDFQNLTGISLSKDTSMKINNVKESFKNSWICIQMQIISKI